MLEALQRHIRFTIESCCEEPTHRAALLRILRRRGYALGPDGPCRAGLFTLEVFRAIRGSPTTEAYVAAVAVELQMEAAFMFDNAADRNPGSWPPVSPSEELALAITLQMCGSAAACEAVRQSQVDDLEVLHHSVKSCLDSCAGQFLGTVLEQRDLTTADEALRMTCLKSGSLGRFAAGVGGRMATDDGRILQVCEDLGFNLFTYAQLVDDLRDAFVPGATGDLAQRKSTVPLVFFRNSRIAQLRGSTSGRIALPSCTAPGANEIAAAELYGALVAEVFLNRAREGLAQLRSLRCVVEHLERFVESIETASADAFAGTPVPCE